MCGFCLLKKFEKQCDYDESSQFACDTERRMNGHVKSMHFQQLMEAAAGMFLFFLHLLLCRKCRKAVEHNCTFSCFSFVRAVVVIFDALLLPSAA